MDRYSEYTHRYGFQFRHPTGTLTSFSFVREFLDLVQSEILIHVTDWPAYLPAEMITVCALRRYCWDESRSLLEAPGHLFQSSETEQLIALYGTVGNFEWNAYLYTPNDQATIYNWEGEICDFWTNNQGLNDAALKLVDRYGLEMAV